MQPSIDGAGLPWRYSIATYGMRRQLDRQCLTEHFHCAFGDIIRTELMSRNRHRRTNRCDHDDAAALALLDHVLSGTLCSEKGALDIDLIQTLDLGWRLFQERLVERDTSGGNAALWSV